MLLYKIHNEYTFVTSDMIYVDVRCICDVNQTDGIDLELYIGADGYATVSASVKLDSDAMADLPIDVYDEIMMKAQLIASDFYTMTHTMIHRQRGEHTFSLIDDLKEIEDMCHDLREYFMRCIDNHAPSLAQHVTFVTSWVEPLS